VRQVQSLRPDPAQRHHLIEIRDNLEAGIIETQREGWPGEVEGPQVSLPGARTRLSASTRRSHTGSRRSNSAFR